MELDTIGYARESILVGAASVGFTPANIEGKFPLAATCSVEGEPIRISFDGESPASDGIIMPAGSVFEVVGQRQIGSFRMIRSGGADATVKVHYLHAAGGGRYGL